MLPNDQGVEVNNTATTDEKDVGRDEIIEREEKSERDQRMEQDEAVDQEQVGHMQEVIPRLWIGDIFAATDEKALKEAGITSVMSILRQKVKVPAGILSIPLPLDDSPDTDILSHLPQSVERIQTVLAEQGSGGVLVHCQAGMSRSATIIAAYLMKTQNMTAQEALDLLREKRPVVYPSETFQEQLLIYEASGCRVSIRDKQTRQWYMDRTTAQVVNQGEWPDDAKIAKFPSSPTPSHPATPPGGHGRRKVRCRNCRRQLATREHMMPHIFDQAPLSRPRTPSVGGGAYAMSPLSGAIDDASTGTRSRTDASFGSSKPMPSISCTLSESAGTETAPEAIQGGPNANPAASASASASASPSSSSSPSSRDQGRPAFIPNGGGRGRGGPVLSAAELAARLPPHLAALRAGVPPRSQASSVPMPQPSLSPTPTPTTTNRTGSAPNALGISSPSLASPQDGDNSKIQQPSQPPPPPQPATADSAVADEPIDVDPPVNRNMIATRLSMSSMDVGNTAAAAGLSEGSSGRKSSISDSKRPSLDLDTMNLRRESISNTPASTPILVNPLCSGYFVEPIAWMEDFLSEGQLAGKIICPNEKCKAKIGSYDWAGIQCGCKEWVIPGFCIHRSKVDEVW